MVSSLDDREKEAEVKQKEAEVRTAVAEADKAEAEAKQAKLKAQFPSGETKPVEGKITTDDKSGYIATLAGYDALVLRADEIAQIINRLNLEKARIIIVNSLDFVSADVQLIQVLKQISYCDSLIDDQIKNIRNYIENIKDIINPKKKAKGLPAEEALEVETALQVPGVAILSGFGSAVQIAKGVISSLADIVGYFKVDYDIKGQDINLSNTALHSLVAGHIATAGRTVFLPGFFRIPPSASINVLDKFNNLIGNKHGLKAETDELKGLLSHPKVQDKKKEGDPSISEAEKACNDTETIIKELDEFNKALITAPQGGGYSPLAAAALRQFLDVKGITHLLYLAVTSSGGEMVTGKGPFYWGSPGFLGGCVITYALAKTSGEILASDAVFGYSGVKYHLCRNELSPFKHR